MLSLLVKVGAQRLLLSLGSKGLRGRVCGVRMAGWGWCSKGRSCLEEASEDKPQWGKRSWVASPGCWLGVETLGVGGGVGGEEKGKQKEEQTTFTRSTD